MIICVYKTKDCTHWLVEEKKFPEKISRFRYRNLQSGLVKIKPKPPVSEIFFHPNALKEELLNGATEADPGNSDAVQHPVDY